jgi:hypothetical protein
MGTRIWQCGFETNTTTEMKQVYTGAVSGSSISTAQFYSGLRSLAFQQNLGAWGWSFSGVAQISAHMFMRHAGLGGGSGVATDWSPIFRWTSSASSLNWFRWRPFTNQLELVVANVIVDAVAPTELGFNTLNTWASVALVVKADSAAGFATVYFESQPLLHAEGIDTGTNISVLALPHVTGSTAPSVTWAGAGYVDDIYIDDTTGEQNSPPIPRRFVYALPNGAGYSTQWTPNTGTNWQAVDEIPPDSETTYVLAESAGLVDAYDVTTPVVPAGYTVAAVIPTVYARRASSTEQIKVGLSDATNHAAGTAQDLTAAYNPPLYERYTTKPAGGAWAEADLVGVQARVESAGTY